MARLGRAQPGYRSGHSVLRLPAVVGAAAAPFIAERVDVRLADQTRNQIVAGRRAAHYELRAPSVLFDAVVWHGPGVKLAPAEDHRGHERRRTKSELRLPAVVGAANIFRPIETSLADHPRQGRLPSSRLAPPEVVGAAVATEVYPGPRVELARAQPGDPRRKAQYDIAGPIVVFPKDGFGGIGTQLAETRNARSDGRRAPHSKLSEPAVVTAAAAPFVAEPVRIARAESHRPATTRVELRPPIVLDPAIVYPGPRESLAEHHRPAPTHSELRAPAVVAPAVTYRPVQTHLAPSHRPAPTRPELRAPAVVAPAVTYRPVAVNLTTPHRPPATRSRLAPPAVVGPANIYANRYALTERRKPRLVQSELRPPTVIEQPAQPPLDVTVDVMLAPSGDPRRHFAKPDLRAPMVVGPAAVYRPVETELAPQSLQGRAPHSELRAPVVVDPAVVYPSVSTSLAAQARQARKPHSRLAPPTVVAPFIARPVLVTKAPGREIALRRPAQSTTYIEFVTYPPVETVVRVKLTDHPQRREHRSFRTPIFGILDVIAPVLGHFDEPTPSGSFFDEPTPGGAHFDRSGPSAAAFDEPTPEGGQFDEPTPAAGHFDEPTPS